MNDHARRQSSAPGVPEPRASEATLRSLEALYWRMLGKKVRANNVLNGRRDTFVTRLKKGYFEGGWKTTPPVVRESQPVDTIDPVADDRSTPAGGPKSRVPLPFYGLERQQFASNEVIFTCVVGDRHALQESDSDHEHALYADHDLGLRGWEQRPLLFWDANPKLITLFHKYAMASFVEPGTKLLWVDSRVSISSEVARQVFAALDSHDLCVFRHYERDCLYEELLAVVAAKRAPVEQAEEYSKYLKQRGFPRHAGLFETGVLGFRVTPATIRLFRHVFALSYRYIARDQLTLPVALADNLVRLYVYGSGETHLRNTPGIIVYSWNGRA